MKQDDLDFQREMSDVQPLFQGRDKADLSSSKPAAPSPAQIARRANAEHAVDEDNYLSDDFVELVGSHDPLEFRRDGIQIGVFDRLRHGDYMPDAQLYLVKRPLAECRRELFQFLKEGYDHGMRCVMLIHGRGKHDDSRANVLRSYVAKWLCQFEEVQAYTSAPASRGGLGTTYVMLKKSEKARARNRERQQKRRG
ncbi:DNA endonuclease SmrA [Aidingimonas lacisalsi]|uniref:DNA endonuclease SmrA n=1 Tax=Aidingimonas lacisalsi TaxID=2604086 RepID=UPI0011D213DA|nr:DNA endonuclease SmrA [Aidingimonas lacisalsi]